MDNLIKDWFVVSPHNSPSPLNCLEQDEMTETDKVEEIQQWIETVNKTVDENSPQKSDNGSSSSSPQESDDGSSSIAVIEEEIASASHDHCKNEDKSSPPLFDDLESKEKEKGGQKTLVPSLLDGLEYLEDKKEKAIKSAPSFLDGLESMEGKKKAINSAPSLCDGLETKEKEREEQKKKLSNFMLTNKQTRVDTNEILRKAKAKLKDLQKNTNELRSRNTSHCVDHQTKTKQNIKKCRPQHFQALDHRSQHTVQTRELSNLEVLPLFELAMLGFAICMVACAVIYSFHTGSVDHFKDPFKAIKVELESLNETIVGLKQENHLLWKQMFHHEKNENRKLISLTRLILQKMEEGKNASKIYKEQYEIEAHYQKKISKLKEEIAVLQRHITVVYSSLNETMKKQIGTPNIYSDSSPKKFSLDKGGFVALAVFVFFSVSAVVCLFLLRAVRQYRYENFSKINQGVYRSRKSPKSHESPQKVMK